MSRRVISFLVTKLLCSSVIQRDPITPQVGFGWVALCATISVTKSDPSEDTTRSRIGSPASAARPAAVLDCTWTQLCVALRQEHSMSELFSFGAWVRQRRRALDLTRDGLAAQVGCSVATIRRIEADERRPSKQLAARLADYLHISPEEHAAFLQAARGELAVDRLAAPAASLERSSAGG